MKENVNDLVRLHNAMQEKLKTASYSEQIEKKDYVSVSKGVHKQKLGNLQKFL